MTYTPTLIGLAEITGAYSLTVGELIQLREFIRRHDDLLPEYEPGKYDLAAITTALRIVTKKTRRA